MARFTSFMYTGQGFQCGGFSGRSGSVGGVWPHLQNQDCYPSQARDISSYSYPNEIGHGIGFGSVDGPFDFYGTYTRHDLQSDLGRDLGQHRVGRDGPSVVMHRLSHAGYFLGHQNRLCFGPNVGQSLGHVSR